MLHPMSSSLSVIPAGARERFLPLLLLADESEPQVRGYLDRGDLYAYSAADAPVAGVILVAPVDAQTVELKAVAIDPTLQSQGIGKRMLEEVIARLRAQGYRRVIVGTASASIGALAYYQKSGFRLLRVERDFFTPARGYPETMTENGILVRDMVWMDRTLGPPARD